MFRAPGLWSAALLCATMLAWPAFLFGNDRTKTFQMQ
jgi:hypothetical protein